MKKMFTKMMDMLSDVKAGIQVFRLAKKYSDRNRETSLKLLKDTYGTN